MKDEIIIKRMNYREPLKNHFEAQKISGRMALFLNGESFSGKLLLEYDSGNLYSEGMIKNGFKEGEWRTFYETGELMCECPVVDNKFFGDYKQYNKYNVLVYKCFIRNNMKNGDEIYYDRQGKEIIKRKYVNNREIKS